MLFFIWLLNLLVEFEIEGGNTWSVTYNDTQNVVCDQARFFRGFIFVGMVMNYGDFEIKKNKVGTKGSWTTTVLCKL